MKKICVFVMVLLFLLAAFSLTACVGDNGGTQDDGKGEGITLSVPLEVHIEGRDVYWSIVQNASSYKVDIDGMQSSTVTASYSLEQLTTPKTYSIKVKAVGDGTNYYDSDWSEAVNYIVEVSPLAAPKKLEINDEGILTFESVSGATSYEISVNDQLLDSVTTASYNFVVPETAGLYLIRVAARSDDSEMPDSGFSAPCPLIVGTPGLLYTLSDDETYYSVSLGDAEQSDIFVPSTYEGKPVTHIEPRAFVDITKRTDIIFPASIKQVGYGAFSAHFVTNVTWIYNSKVKIVDDINTGLRYNLTKVIIPSGETEISNDGLSNSDGLKELVWEGNEVTSIGSNAFAFTALEHISIPDSVTSIGSHAFTGSHFKQINFTPNSGLKTIATAAFYNCADLQNMSLPQSLTTIGSSAFSGCSELTAINIPKSVTSIGSPLFPACDKLTEVTVNEYNSVYQSINNCIIKKEGNILIAGCNTSVIPAQTQIIAQAFWGCNLLESVTIPSSVTQISTYAFQNSGVKSVIFASDSQLEKIGGYAFANCVNLNSITLPSSLKELGDIEFSENGMIQTGSVFYECENLKTVVFADNCGVEYILNNTFAYCKKLESVNFGENNRINDIGERAFYRCVSLTNIIIPKLVRVLRSYAFTDCQQLSDITFNNSGSFEIIQDHVFAGCTALSIVTLPNSLNVIYEYAFSNTGLTEITIPEGVTYLLSGVFQGCIYLEKATLPASLNVIAVDPSISIDGTDGSTFGGCTALAQIILNENNQSFVIENGILFDKELTRIIYIPLAFSGDIVLPSTLQYLGETAQELSNKFINRKGITSISFPDSITEIISVIFEGCDSLQDFYVNETHASLLEIDGVLYNKDGVGSSYYSSVLKSFPNGRTGEYTVPDFVSTIDVYAFANCSLSSVIFTQNVYRLNYGAFINSKNLVSVTVINPDYGIGLQYFEESVFENCTKLTGIIYDGYNNTVQYTRNVFANCISMTSFTVGIRVEIMNAEMFAGSSVESIYFDHYINDPDSPVWVSTRIPQVNYSNGSFTGITLKNLYVDASVIDVYRNEASNRGWSDYINIIRTKPSP